MSITKDGFFKQKDQLSNVYVLLAAGGHQRFGNAVGDIPVSNQLLNAGLDADMLDGKHIDELFTAFSGGAISSSDNTMSQANHSITIGGVTLYAGSSSANIVNNISVSTLLSNMTTNLTVGITVNGVASSNVSLTDLYARDSDKLDGKHLSELFTEFDDIGSQTTRITIGGVTKDLKIDADKLDGKHIDELFTAFTGGTISSANNTLTQTNHAITIGGVTLYAGSSTANIINSLSVSKLTSDSTTNLTVGITVNGVASADKTITDLYATNAGNADTVDGYHFSDLEDRYVNVSGDWMDEDAQLSFKGPSGSTSIYARLGYMSTSLSGFTMHGGGQNKAFYIHSNGYAANSDTGGLAIDNDGVTIFGAGDDGKVFRVLNEDNVDDGPQFLVTKGSGATTKYTHTAQRFISTVAIGTQPYACSSTTLNNNLNADLLDDKHATQFLEWEAMKSGWDSAPFQEAVDYFKNLSNLNNGAKILYSYYGGEYTMLFTRRNDATAHGTILKWGYPDTYIRIIRLTSGNPASSNWEKISAGYADSAGTANYATNAGNADTLDGYHLSNLYWANINVQTSLSTDTTPQFGRVGIGTAYKTGGDGLLNFPRDNVAINFRQDSGCYSKIEYMSLGNEALVFANQYPHSSFIFKNNLNLTNTNDWQESNLGTPAVQIKYSSLYINKAIGNGVTPDYNFYVNGNSYLNGRTIVNYAASNGTGALEINAGGASYAYALDIQSSITTGDTLVAFVMGVAHGTNNQLSGLFKYVGSGSTSNLFGFGFYGNDFLLNIRADGNVGIGTSSPSQKLHVAGNEYITGYINLNDHGYLQSGRSTSFNYGYSLSLGDSGNSMGMFSGPGGGEEGAIIVSPDTCIVYNSSDTGHNFSVYDKDLGGDLTTNTSLTFDIIGNGDYRAWSRGGFYKNGSSDSYVLLGAGGHKALDDFSMVGHTHNRLEQNLILACSLYATGSYNAYKIITKWNKSWNHMPTINIRGYAYGSSKTIDCDIVIYHYSDTPCSYSCTNKGSYPIEVYQQLENDVQVFYIRPGEYYGMFNVFVYGGMGVTSDYYTGWTMTTVDAVQGTRITQYAIATDITGSASYATNAGNADTLDGYHFQNLEDRYVNVSGDWMDDSAQLYWKGLNGSTSVYTVMGYNSYGSTNMPTYAKDAHNDTKAFYIMSNGYNAGNDLGGLSIDDEGVSVFGAGDGANNFTGVFRVFNEDNFDDGPQFIVTKNTGAAVKYNLSVGQNTVNTSYKLYVNGTGCFENNIRINSGYPHIDMYSTGSESSIYFRPSSGTSWAIGKAPWGVGGFGIGILGDGCKFTILDNGNVGIGTTTPTYKFDVNGIAHATRVIINNANVGSDSLTVGGCIRITGGSTTSNMNAGLRRIFFGDGTNACLGEGGNGEDSDWMYIRGYHKILLECNSGSTTIDINGYPNSPGFKKTESSDSYVLLGGGGHKLESSLSVSNADMVDNIHASGFLGWTGMSASGGSSAPFQTCVDFFNNTANLNNGGRMIYNYPGDEYTILFTRRSDATGHGSILKWGYPNNYIWIIRMINGNPQSSDWQKIYAGYADSAGYANSAGTANSVSWTNVTSGTNNKTLYLDFPSFVFRDANGGWILGKADNGSGELSLGSSGIAQPVCLNSSGGTVYLTGGGNVGIGTSSPSQKLHVAGNEYITGYINLNDHGYLMSGRSTSFNYGYTFWSTNDLSNSMGMYSGPGGEEGAIVVTPDMCFVYNSSDSGYNFACFDKDVGGNFNSDGVLLFGVRQDSYCWSKGGFIKNGSSDDYFLLGGGGHVARSAYATAHSHPYLPLSGGWMDWAAPIYFQGPNTSVYGRIQYSSTSISGLTMHGGGQSYALYIDSNGYSGAGDTGGIAIDNDGVTAFGAGDTGYVFRVLNEDNVGDGAQFWVTKAGGTYSKRGFIKEGYNDNYVLLAGGGTVAISSLTGGSSTDTNTWRGIYVNDSSWKGNGIDTGYMNIKAGSNVSLSTSGNTLTISSSYSDSDTWRPVQCDGTSIGSSTLNLKSGTNVTLTRSGGDITISASGGSSTSGAYLPLAGGTMTGETIFYSSSDASAFRPDKNNYHYIGTESYRWWKAYINNVYGTFHHKDMNSNDYVLLAGGGYKALSEFGGSGGGGMSSLTITNSASSSRYVLGYSSYSGSTTEVYACSQFYFTTSGAYHSSDRSLKHDIRDLLYTDVQRLFNTENGYIRSFAWNSNNKQVYGVIAQELQEYCPEAVDFNEDSQTYYVDYNVAFSKIIGAMFKKIKEQDKIIKELQSKVK